MNQKVYGVALAGAGMVSGAHADSILELDSTDLKVVYSRTEARAKKFADSYSVPWTCDYGEIIKRDDVDIVDITTAPWRHADMGIAAAEAGKHVIVEKPMDVSLEKCGMLIDACRKNNVKLAVIFQNRYKKAVRRVKNYCDSGGLGTLLYAGAHVKWYRPQEYYDGDDWRGQKKTEGGGVVFGQAGHSLDLLMWIFGPVEEVYARTAATPVHRHIDVEDLGIVSLKFKNGALGALEAATSLYPGMSERIELHGTRGTIVIEQGRIKMWEIKNPGPGDAPGDVEEETGTGARDPMAFPITWHKLQIEDMCRAIDEDREPEINGYEGRKLNSVCRCIYQSAESNSPVAVAEDA